MQDHDRVQEILAAYALGAIDEEHLGEVDDPLEHHLPACPACREALESFHWVAGELGLAAEPRMPPRTLQSRLRRDVRPGRRMSFVPVAASSAALILVGGLLAWGAHLSGRVSRAEGRQARTTEVLAAVTHPQSHVVPLSSRVSGGMMVQLAATYVPGRPALYLFGSMPTPTPHRVYQLWLVHAGAFTSAGTFLPEGGQVLASFTVDPTVYDGLLITEESPPGSVRPSDRYLVTASL